MAQTQCLSHFILAGVEGLEPSRTVLETGMLPLHHTPMIATVILYAKGDEMSRTIWMILKNY